MIIAQNISKNFGKIEALKGISFEIGKGEIVGFLGKNGAGKTTLMRILTSYLPPTSGKVSIAGQDIERNPLAIRRKIGYLPENPPLYLNMTVREYLKFAARLKDIPARETRARAAADGRRFEDGISLLLHQGAASFEFWTRSRAPLAAMKAALGMA